MANTKKALVVGINDYPQSRLKGSVNDASSVAEIIKNNGDESPNFDVRLVTDVRTKAELKALIIELFKGNSDTSLFYFSGHGYLDEVGGYIVTPDYTKFDVGVSMSEILTIANQSKSQNRIIVLDCCNSGAFGSSNIAGASAAQISEGVSILTASKDDESAIEVNGRSVFTNLFLEALKGGSADLRGHITPGSIYAYIDQALGPWDQRPVFKTNITRFTSIRTIPPQVSLNVLRKLIEYFPSPQEQFLLDPSFEDTNAEDIVHGIVEPYATPDNVEKFKNLQKLQSVGLVIPVDEEHMYYAAMNSKSCKLTALGSHYWRLIKDRRI